MSIGWRLAWVKIMQKDQELEQALKTVYYVTKRMCLHIHVKVFSLGIIARLAYVSNILSS